MEIENKYTTETDLVNLLNDPDFDRIELGLKRVNIFDILKISRAEIRHSNFLGWLMDPNENHGFNELVLKRTLRDLFNSEKAFGLTALDADNLNYDKVEVKREWLNIDLLLVIDGKVICIENKVDSKEHSNQLAKYHNLVHEHYPALEKIFVYLTPNGDDPTSQHEAYIPYSYVKFAENLEKLIQVYGQTLNEKNLNYISDYLSILKRTIMQNDELNDLAAKLYNSHKATFNFIFENLPDKEKEIRQIFENEVEKKGWKLGSKNKGNVRFLTEKLSQIIPTYSFSNGWPNRESFLFEIDFYWSTGKRNLVFKTTISPGEEDVREILRDVLSNIEGAQKPWGEKWLSHFIKNFKFPWDKMEQLENDEISEVISEILDQLVDFIYTVEAAIIADGRLQNLK